MYRGTHLPKCFTELGQSSSQLNLSEINTSIIQETASGFGSGIQTISVNPNNGLQKGVIFTGEHISRMAVS